MDSRKLDAWLSAALVAPEEAGEVTIFISTVEPLDAARAGLLRKLGVGQAAAGQKLLTATVPKQVIGELSEQPWVRALKLSQQLRPLESK